MDYFFIFARRPHRQTKVKNSIYETEGISLSSNVKEDLAAWCRPYPADKIFVLLDQNTREFCWPLIEGFTDLPPDNIFVMGQGEENKNIRQVEHVWNFLGENRADRKSVLINVGGGMLTDLGGFAAATFKRGIDFINLPTTLLAQVDASVGGKTGINFRGLKNEIGLIRMPLHVFLFLPFLRTLDEANFRSGLAELLKAALICDASLWKELSVFDPDNKNEDQLTQWLWQAVMIKKDIVDRDPEEAGDRKALNFGHTIGHALESYSLDTGSPVLHGYAVAWGMMAEARLSASENGLTDEAVRQISSVMLRIYGDPPLRIRDLMPMLRLMRFDKKNERNRINFTLLNRIGSFSVNHYVEEEKITTLLSSAW